MPEIKNEDNNISNNYNNNISNSSNNIKEEQQMLKVKRERTAEVKAEQKDKLGIHNHVINKISENYRDKYKNIQKYYGKKYIYFYFTNKTSI